MDGPYYVPVVEVFEDEEGDFETEIIDQVVGTNLKVEDRGK